MTKNEIPKAGAPQFWTFARKVAGTASSRVRAREQFKRDWRAQHPQATEEEVAIAYAELDEIFSA